MSNNSANRRAPTSSYNLQNSNETKQERKLSKKEYYEKNFSTKAGPLSMDKLKLWGRYFHNNIPPNPYQRRKYPWKTILIVSIFQY